MTPIGLLELGARSTAFYERFLREARGVPPARLQRVPTDFDAINSRLPDQFSALSELVRPYFDGFETGQIVVVPNITLHEAIDAMDLPNINLIHPVRSAARELSDAGIDNVVLIASIYSMRAAYIRDIFAREQVKVSAADETDFAVLDSLRRKIYAGEETETEQRRFTRILTEYSKTQPVILGCTEFSALMRDPLPGRVYDMARIQMREAAP